MVLRFEFDVIWVWCGHKDILRWDKCTSFQEKKWQTSVVSAVANPSPAPALIALNNLTR